MAFDVGRDARDASGRSTAGGQGADPGKHKAGSGLPTPEEEVLGLDIAMAFLIYVAT